MGGRYGSRARRLGGILMAACLTVGGGGSGAPGVAASAVAPHPDSAAQLATGASPTILAVSTGWVHTCALLDGGDIYCWGDGYGGELGDGATIDRPSPTKVAGLVGATAISAGGEQTCAIAGSAHEVWCWGNNWFGEVGDGTRIRRTSPVSTGVTDAVAISAGLWYTCALLSTGHITCWGRNTWGTLGDGSHAHSLCAGQECSMTPVEVLGITDATAIAAGGYHACALVTGGAVKCWGSGEFGALGNGTWDDTSAPVLVTGITASAIAAGYQHTCAVVATGVACWGSNGSGQVGDGTTFDSNVPLTVSGTSGVTAVTAGGWRSCGLFGADGSVTCWGDNTDGALGDGSTTSRSTPVAVKDLGGVNDLAGATAMAAGGRHTCGLVAGAMACWGWNWVGALGDSTPANRSVPTAVYWPPTGTPDAPIDPQALAGSAAATVSWPAPADGGSPITGYGATSSGDHHCTAGPTSTSCSTTGLTVNTAYRFTVAATNANGTGPAALTGAVAPTTGTLKATISKATMGKLASSPVRVALAWTTGLDQLGPEYTLARLSGSTWTPIALPNSTARTAAVSLTPGTRYTYGVRATTEDDAVGTWIKLPTFRALARQDGTSLVKLGGTGWTKTTSGSPYGGTLRYASAARRTATTTFTGTGVAWVSTLGRNRGRAEVWLDGKRVATIDLYRATTLARQVVWSSSALTLRSHTVVVKVLGTHRSAATGSRVDLDAFIVLVP